MQSKLISIAAQHEVKDSNFKVNNGNIDSV